MHMTVAIIEKLSTHCKMLVMGSRAGTGGRPGSIGGDHDSSVVMSAIYTNSRSRIFLTNFVGKEAVGLNGPGVEIDRLADGEGVVVPNSARGDTANDAPARTSSPEGTIWDGVTVVVVPRSDLYRGSEVTVEFPVLVSLLGLLM